MWWSCVKNIIKINFVCGYVHVCFCPLLCVVRLCFKKEMCVWLCACVFLPFVVCGGVVYFKNFLCVWLCVSVFLSFVLCGGVG